MELRRILVPYDFSEASAHASFYACRLAGRFRAEVTLLHVLPPLRFDFAMAEPVGYLQPQWRAQRTANARAALAALLPDLPLSCGVHYDVMEGEAAQGIIAEANHGGYDAVVMSTLGAGAIRYLIGSVTSRVLQAAEIPVITSSRFEECADSAHWERVLCAIDLGTQSERVLTWARDAAAHENGELRIIHAAPDPTAGLDWAHEAGWQQAAMERLNDRMERLRQKVGATAKTTVKTGGPARVVSEFASQWSADLVVLGRGASQDMLGRLRANAYDIIRQCPCPVVSV